MRYASRTVPASSRDSARGMLLQKILTQRTESGAANGASESQIVSILDPFRRILTKAAQNLLNISRVSVLRSKEEPRLCGFHWRDVRIPDLINLINHPILKISPWHCGPAKFHEFHWFISVNPSYQIRCGASTSAQGRLLMHHITIDKSRRSTTLKYVWRICLEENTTHHVSCALVPTRLL